MLDDKKPAGRYEPEKIDVENPNVCYAIELKLIGNNKTVLEVGPATGYITRILKDMGNEVYCVEIDEEAAKIAEKYCDGLIVGDVEELNFDDYFKPEQFDVILFGDVLEHLKWPGRVLKKVKKYLKPDGYIVASIPNIAHGDVILNLISGRFNYRSMGLLDETHLRFFTIDGILRMFRESGYKVTEVYTTKVEIGYSELGDVVKKVPQPIINFIRKLPHSNVYQFVIKAHKAEYPAEEVNMEEISISSIPIEEIVELQRRMQEYDREIRELRFSLEYKEERIKELQENLQRLSAEAHQKGNMVAELEKALKIKDGELSRLQQEIESLRELVRDREAEIERLNGELESERERVSALTKSLEEKTKELNEFKVKSINLEQKIRSLEGELKEKGSLVERLNGELTAREKAIEELRKEEQRVKSELAAREEQIRNLTEENIRLAAELDSIKSSVTWRAVMKWHSFVEKIAPVGTRRRRWYDQAIMWTRSLKLPKFFQKMISAWKLYRERGLKVLVHEIRKEIRASIYNRYYTIRYRKSVEDFTPTLQNVIINNKKSSNKCACTIVSKNYLAHAITLMKSFKKHNPDWDFKILLCDMLEDVEDLEIFVKLYDYIIPIYAITNNLKVSKLEEMLFKYNVIEMNTAIKPFFLEYLLRSGYEKVIYFDPDILILDSIENIDWQLDNSNIVLTPHICESLPSDNKKPSDIDILRAGIYNLGFIGIKNSPETLRFLKWWQDKLQDGCFMNVESGFHVDQKWIDFVPVFFRDVHVIHDKKYNIAYWNLHERKNISGKNDGFYLDNGRVVFFHFSGFDPTNIDIISKHQDRFSLKELPNLKPLFNLYKKQLLDNGFILFKDKQYYFNRFAGTNVNIPKELRRLYLEIFEIDRNLNPWNPDHAERVVSYANSEYCKGVTRLWYEIYKKRFDVQKVYPDICSSEKDREGFRGWIRNSGVREHNLHNVFVDGGSIRPYITKTNFGVNLFGYFKNIIGVGQVARHIFKAVKKIGIPFTLFNILSKHHKYIPLEEFQEFEKFISSNNIYNVNVLFVNADQTPNIFDHYKQKLEGKYNIGVWWWELENYFPFSESCELVDEIWVFSDFIYKTVRKHTDKPVTKLPYFFEPDWTYLTPPLEVRKKLGIKEEDLVFVYSFDYFSGFERKNPDGVIKAFTEAFGNNVEDVKLIVKSLHHEYFPNQDRYLRELINKSDNIIYLTGELPRNDYISLINAADCFVSLHRSEGLGLNILEAMYLGKCVISTAYGGNMDFTTKQNSLLVDFEYTPIKEDFGPYKRGILWADPDVSQCAEYMRSIYEDRERAVELGKKAAEDVRKMAHQSPKAMAVRLKKIYDDIMT